MENGLVTSDGTKVLTVAEYDRFVNSIPTKFRPIFEVKTITGLRYVELQRLHKHEERYYTERNHQIIIPRDTQRKVYNAAKNNLPVFESIKAAFNRAPLTIP